MQNVFGSPVVNSNTLVCTANDIRLARATSVSPGSCVENTVFDLTATFEVVVTANSRYDAGFFFRIDGGSNARGDGSGATGTCSLSALTRNINPALNLDGDTCGDLNAGTYEVTFTIPDVLCTGVPNPANPAQKILKLPNCTSWHSNQGTACEITNAFDFDPDTKSKCVCDDNFTVPVIVETASLRVTKTATPTSVPETGLNVTYDVSVTNSAQFVSVRIDTLIDDIYGSLTFSPSCASLVGVVLGPGQTATCQFQAFAQGNAGDQITDIVEVCGTQSNTGAIICGDDDATVTIVDAASTPALTKDATGFDPVSCNLTVDVTYTVGVSNPSTIDSLTVNALTDNQFGNITQVQGNVVSTTCVPDGNPVTCEVGGTIPPSSSCSCTFVGRITGGGSSCSFTHTNTVTGDVTDDDGVNSTPSDGATVNVTATVDVTTP
jgi:hypothetical protein